MTVPRSTSSAPERGRGMRWRAGGLTRREPTGPASRARAEPIWPPLALAGVVALTLALHVAWLVRFRLGYLTEWDEAGYIQIAVLDHAAFRDDGPVGLLRMVLGQPGQAPLVPLAAVPVYLGFGPGVFQSLLVVPAFFAALVVATFALARRLVASPWALLAAVTVAAAPVVTDYTRLFHFSVPAAACLTAALWALVRTDRLRLSGWAVAFGVLTGLMVLTRTMTIAYLPALALAAGAHALAGRSERRRRLRNLGLAGLSAALVAATWYGPNTGSVASYLLEAGYGAESARYGESRPVSSWAFWTKQLGILTRELYLPLALALLACIAAGAVSATRRSTSVGAAVRSWLAHDSFPVAVVVAGGYLALTSSTNEGTAFSLPWIPALVVLAVAAAARVAPRRLGIALALSLAALAAMNAAAKSGFGGPLAEPRALTMGPLGSAVVSDGYGIIQREVAAAGYEVGEPGDRLPRIHRGWLPLEREVARRIVRSANELGETPHVVVGVDDLLFNNTRLRLAGALEHGEYLRAGRLTPALDGDTAPAYERRLRDSGARFLVTAEAKAGVPSAVTTAEVVRAARRLGFEELWTFTLPDGRRGQLWWGRDRAARP